MIFAPRRATWLALGLAAVALAWSTATPDPSLAAASGTDPFLDTDSDLIPDSLEWVIFADPARTDTDADGRDDFLEVVQHSAPWAPTGARPYDNEMRMLLSAVGSDNDSSAGIWLHCLFRFASGTPCIEWFSPHINSNGVSVPIAGLFGRTPFRLTVRDVPGEGSYAILSMFLAWEHEFRHILPCTVSARASVGGRVFSTGTYVQDLDGPTAMLPKGLDASRKSFLLQSLLPDDSSSSFFRRNKICEMELVIIGSTGGGHLCEVDQAACLPANGLRCNATCDQAAGSMVFVPDGLGTISGG